jgi:hypothetical protein
MLKLVVWTIFINSSPFALIIINVKILSNFQKEWCTFGKKKRHLKKTRIVHSWCLNALNMQKHFWYVSSFEHINLEINEKYSKTNYDNPNYYASFVIFQTYKNVVLKNVHSFGQLLWLCFYPRIISSKRTMFSKEQRLMLPRRKIMLPREQPCSWRSKGLRCLKEQLYS